VPAASTCLLAPRPPGRIGSAAQRHGRQPGGVPGRQVLSPPPGGPVAFFLTPLRAGGCGPALAIT